MGFPIESIGLPGEIVPLEAGSVDTVVTTCTLCIILDAGAAMLRGMRRVLKPGGQLLFAEHGRAPNQSVLKWQDRLDPLWGKIAGGCHLSRDNPALLRHGGLTPERLEKAYIAGPKPISFNYWGAAAPS